MCLGDQVYGRLSGAERTGRILNLVGLHPTVTERMTETEGLS